ncbi:MAG TPA: hypothetical protein VFN87_03025 [Solirubrobacteraceae bacterium]|nr:hypothetical protein [Solirubrobacteraceae bacterium]
MTYATPAAHPAARSRAGSLSSAVVVALVLFAAGALISAFSMRNGIDPFDEGLMLQAARRIAAGQVPYRDFLWAYGPGAPYVLAGLFKVFGVSLLQWRILRVLADAAIALVAYLLVADRAPRTVSLAVWLAVACEISEPRTADPFPPALLAILLTLLIACGGPPSRGRQLAAALVTAVGAAFRLDLGIYALAAGAVAFAAADEPPAGRAAAGWRVRLAAGYGVAAVALGVLVYVPFAIIDGPGGLYHALIGNSLNTGNYWSLPFPLHFHAPPGAGTAKTAKKALDFYVPLLTIVGYAGTVVATAALWWRDRRAPALLLGLVVAGAGLLAYLLSRTDPQHVQPLFVIVAVALGVITGHGARMTGQRVRASGRRGWGGGRRRAPVIAGRRGLPAGGSGPVTGRRSIAAPAALATAALLGLLLLHGVGNRLSALVHPPAAAALNVPVADGVQAPPAEAQAIDRMVAIVDALVPAGQPIYVAPRRADLVTFNDPLIYVLTQRDNPTRQDFGLQAGAVAQAQIVAALDRVRPRVIVRWTDPMSSQPEPNLRGRSTGVHTLDRWIAAHYRLRTRLYHYDVLVRRGGSGR